MPSVSEYYVVSTLIDLDQSTQPRPACFDHTLIYFDAYSTSIQQQMDGCSYLKHVEV